MDDLLLGFRFDVFFFPGAASSAGNARQQAQASGLDFRFQQVKGLAAGVETRPYPEGGQNLYSPKLPIGIDYDHLVLERGMVVKSPLTESFDEAMSLFKFAPSNVLVSLLSEQKAPVAAWLFLNAYPVRWSTSDLDANQNSLVIDTLELAYSRIQKMEV